MESKRNVRKNKQTTKTNLKQKNPFCIFANLSVNTWMKIRSNVFVGFIKYGHLILAPPMLTFACL